MKISGFWRSRIFRHGLVWLLIIGALIAAHQIVTNTGRKSAGHTLLMLAFTALPIYVHYWLLTHLFDQGRYRRYLVATAATVLAGAGLLDLADFSMQIIVTAQPDPKAEAYTIAEFANTAFGVLLALIISTIARYVRRGITSHFQMKQLRALQVGTELSLLKAQVNQHFLFNTLNNLYGLSLAAPEQMPEALLQLAGLMRYQLDSSRQNTVTVGTEAEYLANYIGLEKLRLRANTQVEFTTDLPHPDRPLAPLLLLPLVENCFKHAVGPSGDNTIRIHLHQTDTSLILQTDNSIPTHFRPVPSGLGLPNLRARLAQFYPGKQHSFSVEATDAHYRATLHLLQG